MQLSSIYCCSIRHISERLGAVCLDWTTGSPWPESEKENYINIQKLDTTKCSKFIIIARNKTVHLRMDCMVKLTFNMKMRGAHSETHSDLSKKLWDYLLLNRITFIIVFLPGVLNQVIISKSNQWHAWVDANWIPAGIYLLKVNGRNTRRRCEIISKRNNKGTRTTPGVVLVPLLFTLNIFHTLF